jgi:hypothetical protein
MNNINLKSFLYCFFFIIVFTKMFYVNWDTDWKAKFFVFSVPAMSYPGGDARNIQASAFCSKLGHEFFGENQCIDDGALLKQLYPQASVPSLNYPSIWPRAYALFNDNSEQFFKFFWILNSILLVIAIFILSMKFNYILMPFLLFNPITLLTIERGNIDAIVFFFTFIPIIFLNSSKLIGFFLGFASSLKIFPLFGYLSFFDLKKPSYPVGILIGSIFIAPLLIFSISEVQEIINSTSKGFSVSYGLISIMHANLFFNNEILVYFILIAFIILCGFILIFLNRYKPIQDGLCVFIDQLDKKALTLLSMSVYIYLGTFLVFTNWAYRLIFLIPVLLIVSEKKSMLEKIIFWNIFSIFWIPILPYGWILMNLLCYLLFIPISFLLMSLIKAQKK